MKLITHIHADNTAIMSPGAVTRDLFSIVHYETEPYIADRIPALHIDDYE